MHVIRNMAFLQALSIQAILLLSPLISSPALATINTAEVFDDQPLSDDLIMPEWFKVSFLDLQEDLSEALEHGKQGLIVYFGQKRCAYCKAHLENNWGQKDILAYTQKHFDVIHINIRGQREVTGMDGNSYTEKEFAIKYETNFTPSLVFFNKDGEMVLRLRGYRPPYQFRAALEYVADAHYHQEPFTDYMARAEEAFSFGKETLNTHEAFLPPSTPAMSSRSCRRSSNPVNSVTSRSSCVDPSCWTAAGCRGSGHWSFSSSRVTAMPAMYCMPSR